MKSEYGGIATSKKQQQQQQATIRTIIGGGVDNGQGQAQAGLLLEPTLKCASMKNPGAGGLFDEALIRQVNLAAAFHDHISCTKLPSEICKAGGSIAMLGYNCSPFDSQTGMGMFGSPYSSHSEDKEQIGMLREMILAHLDLIQHQQEQLLKKERQLQGLKQDREALCSRIEKSDKRVAVLTKKLITANEVASTAKQAAVDAAMKPLPPASMESSLDSSSFCNFFTENSLADKLSVESGGSSKSDSNAIKADTVDDELTGSGLGLVSPKKRPKKGDKNFTSPQKRSRPSKSADSENSNSSMAVISNSISNGTKVDLKEVRKAAARKRRLTSSMSGAKSIFEEEPLEEVVPPLNSCAIPKEIFLTDQEYDLISVWDKRTFDLPPQGDSNDCDTSTNDIVMAKKGSKELDVKIEVPSFRLNIVAALYNLEGTENLDDDIFLKRHQKLEIDERRRKRWDIQRLREQKHNEKLKQGRYYSSSAFVGGPEKQSMAKKKLPEIESFFPDAKEAHYIEVCDKLPVVAFGNPIPRLPEKPFTLPWGVSVDTTKTPLAVSTSSSSSSSSTSAVSRSRTFHKKSKD